MPSLFISYRRGDSPDTVKLIHERLKKRLPRWEIFYDHESIPLGEQFPDRLRAKVTSATAVLVIVGPKWLEILRERKSAPVDHVRVEVKLALESGASVVPVLAGNAVMPTNEDLTDFADLQPLLQRNGRPVRPDPDFDSDLEPIVTYLKQLDAGESIGTILDDRYTLTAEIGVGGMGVVYLAQQKQPVQRTVAIKLIKPGMDSRDVLARFDAERQALAVMDHPNIAKVLDAGLAASGRPYFVMEHVKGVPITQYCDDKKLTPQERLNLFIPVCNAVQHAHQKGIIHRDLKPSNVLVEVIDGEPVPKVIDFGLAKALGQKLTDKTLYTALDMRLGTLEYSAPEQAAGRSFDVDTRSDIYSLGVLLYELLTGAPPFTHEDLLKVGEEEMRRVIREVEPAKPSKKLSSSGELPAIAANRHLEPNKLTRLVRGDLDWIVMKCLEKENARRYETANQLGDELKRYLADEPVRAGPPSVGYRARKFVRRNKGPVTAAALVFVALLAGIIGTSVGLVKATQAQKRAEEAQKRAEDKEKEAIKERENARRKGEAADKVARLINQMFEGFHPIDTEGPAFAHARQKIGTPAIRKLLDDTAHSVETELTNEPVIQARLLDQLGNLYRSLGWVDQARPLVEKGVALRQKHLGGDHEDTAMSLHHLAWVFQDQRKYHDAEKLYRQALAIRRQKLGNEDLETANTMFNLAWLLGHQFDETVIEETHLARLKEAQKLLDDVLSVRRKHLGENHRDVGMTLLASATLHLVSDEKKALSLAADALAVFQRADKKEPLVSMLGDYLLAKGARELTLLDEADKQYQSVLTGTKAMIGDEDPLYALLLADYAGLLHEKKNLPQAAAKLRKALAIGEKSFLRNHPVMVAGLLELEEIGASLLGQKKYKAAEPLLKEAYEGMKRREKTMPPEAKVRLTEALEHLLQLYDATGNAAEADRCRQELADRKAAAKEPKK